MAERKYRAEGSEAAVDQAKDLPGFFRQWRGWGFCHRRGAGAFEKADDESCAAGAAEKRRGGGESLSEMTLVQVVRKGLLVDGICLVIENFETQQRGGGVGGGRGTMRIVEKQFVVQDDGELLIIEGEGALVRDTVNDARCGLRVGGERARVLRLRRSGRKALRGGCGGEGRRSDH